MKTKDIVVGTDHAYHRWPRSVRHSQYARFDRVRVLETGVEREVGRFYSKAIRRDGVRVQFVKDNGRRITNLDETVVPAEQIVRTWDEELKLRVEREEQERASLDLEFKRAAHLIRTKGYLALLGLAKSVWPVDGNYSVRRDEDFEFTPDELRHLLTTVSLLEHLDSPPAFDQIAPTVRKIRGEDRYEIYVNGIAIGEDWYSKEEAQALANAVREGVKPDAEDE